MVGDGSPGLDTFGLGKVTFLGRVVLLGLLEKLRVGCLDHFQL